MSRDAATCDHRKMLHIHPRGLRFPSIMIKADEFLVIAHVL